MKRSFTLFISCLLYFTVSSQPFKMTFEYGLGLPQSHMAHNIQAVHSLHVGGLYQLPRELKKLSVGLDLGIGVYAHKTIHQTFNFDANTSTVVPVNYNSNVFNANLQARYQFLDEQALVVPYVNAKAGLYNFYSNITIEDPDDPDGCKALDRKNLINDHTFFWGAGAGFQIDPSVFSKHKKNGPIKIDISVNTMYGGKIDYINTKHLKEGHDHDMSEMGGKPLMVKFINVGTQDIHEHMVAQVYSSYLRILEIRGGIIVNLGK